MNSKYTHTTAESVAENIIHLYKLVYKFNTWINGQGQFINASVKNYIYILNLDDTITSLTRIVQHIYLK